MSIRKRVLLCPRATTTTTTEYSATHCPGRVLAGTPFLIDDLMIDNTTAASASCDCLPVEAVVIVVQPMPDAAIATLGNPPALYNNVNSARRPLPRSLIGLTDRMMLG
jgi:hypothetical protein